MLLFAVSYFLFLSPFLFAEDKKASALAEAGTEKATEAFPAAKADVNLMVVSAVYT